MLSDFFQNYDRERERERERERGGGGEFNFSKYIKQKKIPLKKANERFFFLPCFPYPPGATLY